MEARASRSLRTVTADIENRLTISATVTWPSWSMRSSTLRRRCSVSRRGLGVMHRFRIGEYRASLQFGSNDESIAQANTFVFFLFMSLPLCLLLRLLFYCGTSFLLDYFVGRFALKYRVAFACVICLALLFCVSTAVFGQGTDLGTIRGTVTDSTGAVIPSASVTITDALTNTARETKTNAQGNYEMFGLKPGTYRVVITAVGMSKKEITDIVLNGSDT